MGLLQRFLRREPAEPVLCPRCGISAPPSELECTACGWDMRESYHDTVSGEDHAAAR
jgi:hypothetical protein